MIDGLKPYPSYKDSGVPWLGEVPEHWQVTPLCAIARMKSITGVEDRKLLSVYLDRGVIPFSEVDEKRTNVTSEDLSKYQAVDPGDFVLNNQQAWRGSVGVSQHTGIVSPAYLVLALNPVIDPAYANFLFRERAMVDQYLIGSRGVGTIQRNLYWPSLRRIVALLPPLSEQGTVVRFLGHADRRIHRYIRAKQKMVKLLDEEKQTIAHSTVTRGLDSNGPLKASGVQMLGDVPEHWEVVPFKRRVAFQEGPGIMAADFRDEGVPLLRISCLEGDVASLEGCNFLDPDMVRRRWAHFAVRTGDYLLSASASTGSVVLASDIVAGSIPYTGILRLWPISKDVFMPFIRLYMRSEPFKAQIDAAKSGVAIEHFGPTHLKQMVISLPPPEEQRAIVSAVEEKTSPLARAIGRAHREIELIREYRARLIADVVTGKLDVREAAARLPLEVTAAGPLDEIQDLAEDEESAEDAELEAEETG